MLLGSSTLFGVMSFLAKVVSEVIPGSEVAFVRFLVGIIPILLLTRARNAAFTFQRVDILFYRGFFGGVAVLCFFTAIAHIPVGVATLLNYMAPMFSGFFAAIFLDEPLTARVLVPLGVAFGGVILVVKAHAAPGEILGFGIWHLVGLLSAVLSGAAVTAIRGARRTENSWAIFGSFSLFGLLATLPVAAFEWHTPTLFQWMLLVGVAALSIVAQLIMTHAFRWVETLIAGVISQFTVVVAMTMGAIWLGEKITPLSLIGSLLTIGGVVSVVGFTPHKSAEDAELGRPG